MVTLRWTEEAVTWLEDIYRFIAQDSPSAAKRTVDGIYDKAQLLVTLPDIGYLYRREPEGDVKVLLYGHYRIVYLLRERQTVEILGVFHGALDMTRYI